MANLLLYYYNIMVTICFLALSLDIILVGEILKYSYTACIPSCLDNEDVFMIACIDTSSLRRSSLRVMHDLAGAKHFMGVSISFYGCGFLYVCYSEVILY